MSQTVLYNPTDETMPREELEQLQIERLQSTLNRAYRNVAFYRTAFDANRVNLEKIKEVARPARPALYHPGGPAKELPLRHVRRAPARHRADSLDLRDDGEPVVVGYTRNDLRSWTECTARLLVAAGVSEHDVVQIALDYNVSATAFGFHQGAEQVGASVIPMSGVTGAARQVAIMQGLQDDRADLHARLRRGDRGWDRADAGPSRAAEPAAGPLQRRALQRRPAPAASRRNCTSSPPTSTG